MTKVARHLRFGYCVLPSAADSLEPLQLAGTAEELNLDYIGIQDTANQAAGAADYDPWTLLTAMGMATARIRLAAQLAQNPFRSPAQLAQAAVSLARLTGGRVDVGLDADVKGLKELVDALQQGRGQANLSQSLGIWIEGEGADELSVVGQLADGWLIDADPAMPPDARATFCRRLDESAQAAGRDPAPMPRIWRIRGTIGHSEHEQPFQGSVQQWADALAALTVEGGIDTFLLLENPAARKDATVQLERFAREVIPRVRELVDASAQEVVASGLARAKQGAGASGPTPAEAATGRVDEVDESSMESFPASDPPSY